MTERRHRQASQVLRQQQRQLAARLVARQHGLQPEQWRLLRAVLALVAHGLSDAEIADELVISLATVRDHVSTILSEPGASNQRRGNREGSQAWTA